MMKEVENILDDVAIYVGSARAKLDGSLSRKLDMESNLEVQVMLHIKYASDDRSRGTSQY
jgi:hypothetical protein